MGVGICVLHSPPPLPLNYSQGHQMIKKFKIYPPAGPFRQYHCSEHL